MTLRRFVFVGVLTPALFYAVWSWLHQEAPPNATRWRGKPRGAGAVEIEDWMTCG